MANAPIYIAPDPSFDDWVVRESDGRELGHFPTRDAAELAVQPLARARESDLIIQLPDGRERRVSFARGWLRRLLDL